MTTATTKTLSAAQLLILATAAQRSNRMALPLPTDLRARGAAKRALLASLLEAGLLEERPTEEKSPGRLQDGQRHRHALLITAAGLAAVGSLDRPASAGECDMGSAPPSMRRSAGTPGADTVTIRAAGAKADGDVTPAAQAAELAAMPAAHRPRGKLGRVLDAVAGEGGATLAELAELTSWQPHTTRAALTGLRRRGFAVVLSAVEGAGTRKAYRLRSELPT